MKKPLILITNDDGINAPGIRFLIDIMRHIGNVVVVAPDEGQSGMSHAITIKFPLKYRTIESSESYKEYVLNGTPVDCVKFALHYLMDKKPDIVVSGINHGSNASINVIYSGTMAAAREAALGDIPAIGYSILDFSHDANLNYTKEYIIKTTKYVLENGLDNNTALNINFPKANGKEYNGLKVCRQAKAYWKEDFDERFDPRDGKPYYWLMGSFNVHENGSETDLGVLNDYYVSVVPIQLDTTAIKSIEKLSKDL